MNKTRYYDEKEWRAAVQKSYPTGKFRLTAASISYYYGRSLIGKFWPSEGEGFVYLTHESKS